MSHFDIGTHQSLLVTVYFHLPLNAVDIFSLNRFWFFASWQLYISPSRSMEELVVPFL